MEHFKNPKLKIIPKLFLIGIIVFIIIILVVNFSNLIFWNSHKPVILQEYFLESDNQREEWDFKASNTYLDDQGVIKKFIKGDNYYHPVVICQYALLNYTKWINSKSKVFFNKFIRQADWLVENQNKKKVGSLEFGVWYYDFDFPSGGMKAPWVSAMAQGQAISVLSRAYETTKEDRYLKAVDLALNSFEIDISQGGVRYLKDNNVYYEEYPPTNPTKNILTSKNIKGQSEQTLNGFIFSLWGLFDFFKLTGSEKAKTLFEEGVITLKRNIKKYDLGYYSAYDQTNFRPQNLIFKMNYPVELNSITLFYRDKQVKITNLNKSENFFNLTPKSIFDKIKIIYTKNQNKDLLLYFDYELSHALWKLLKISEQDKGSKVEAMFYINPSLYTRRISDKYHLLHIKQLETLSDITGDDYFKKVASKWASYELGKIIVKEQDL